MKITKKILENLIKEELSKLLAEQKTVSTNPKGYFRGRDASGKMVNAGPTTPITNRELYNQMRDAVYNAPAKPKDPNSLEDLQQTINALQKQVKELAAANRSLKDQLADLGAGAGN